MWLVSSWFPGLGIWCESTKSRILDCQRLPRPKEYHLVCTLAEVFILTPRSGSTQLPTEFSGPTQAKQTSMTGKPSCLSADGLPKILLNSQRCQNISSDVTLSIRRKTQLHPPECRHQSLPARSLNKSLNQPHQPEKSKQKQENYSPAACRKEISNTIS